MLAMAKHPNVQKAGQKAIDAVAGPQGRLPDFDDIEQLPYVEAIMKETLRWHPVAPLGVCLAVI